MRSCGKCEECCILYPVAGIPMLGGTIDKPSGVRCPHLANEGHGCSLHGDPSRPSICSQYQCDWIYGAGKTNDRPNKSGILVKTANDIDPSGQPFVFVYELREGAIQCEEGLRFLNDVAKRMPFPLIISEYGSEEIGGDYTIIKHAILPRTSTMRGGHRYKVSDDCAAYDLIKQAA